MHHMTFAADALSPWNLPTYPKISDGTGRKVTIVGGAVSAGEVVRACTDDSEAALDASKAFGPTSWQRVCEKLANGDAADYGLCGMFAIALEDIADDGEGLVADFGVMYANVFVTDGGMASGAPLMVDFTNQRLVPLTATGNTKPVALLATAQPDPGAAAALVRCPVIFSGLLPVAAVANTTS